MAESNPIRVFAAIPATQAIHDLVAVKQQLLKGLLPVGSVKWVAPQHCHLTLRFYGNIAQNEIASLSQALKQTCLGFKSFSICTDLLGCFPDWNRPRVFWLGLNGDMRSLKTVQERVASKTGSWGDHRETHDFSPHLTLGRVKEGHSLFHVPLSEITNLPVEPAAWEVKGVSLFQSTLTPQGPQYQTLDSVSFL